MIPTGLRKRGRCSRVLSAAVLCSMASVVLSGTVAIQQTPAQDRLFDSLLNPFSGWGSGSGSGSGGGSGSGRPYNMPDVAGFGMYPLWKFHKFDGLSLRPVPYGVDIGTGLPPVPPSPSYPAGFPGNSVPVPPPGLPIPIPLPAAVPPPVYRDYGPPAMPALPPYEAAPPAPEGSYSSPPSQNYQPPPPQGYPAPAPQNYQAPPSYPPGAQIISYTPQQYGGSAPPANNYGSSSPASNYGSSSPPVNLAYAPTPGYNEGYNVPPAYGESPAYKEQYAGPSYKEPYAAPSYGGPPPNYGGPAPAGYDGIQYGASQQGIQFSSAPQDYGMQQPNNFVTAGSFQVPNFAALENPMSVTYPQAAEAQQIEQSFGGGGFLKRRSSNPKAESEMLKNLAESEQNASKDISFDSA